MYYLLKRVKNKTFYFFLKYLNINDYLAFFKARHEIIHNLLNSKRTYAAINKNLCIDKR